MANDRGILVTIIQIIKYSINQLMQKWRQLTHLMVFWAKGIWYGIIVIVPIIKT